MQEGAGDGTRSSMYDYTWNCLEVESFLFYVEIVRDEGASGTYVNIYSQK